MESVDPRSFEVFISYKNSDSDGDRTRDAEMAFALHDALEKKGVRAFCSTLSLTRMGQGAYKDAINQALDAAKVMVVVGTNLDNILSPWVKYEWGSFHDDLLTGRKRGGTLVSFISGMNPNELPRELRGYEAFMTEQNGEELIIEFIQAALENKIELGYAGTKPTDGRIGVIGPAAAGGLVNAADPDPDAGNEEPKKSHKGAIIGTILALALACGGGGYAYYQHAQKVAAEEEAARIAAEQKAAEEEAARQAAEYAEKHSSYSVRYLDEESQKKLKKTVSFDDVLVGSTVTVKAPSIKEYTLTSDKKQKITIAKDPNENVITFYYKKDVEPSYSDGGESSYTPPSSGGGSGTGGGGSGDGGGGSKPKPNVIIDDL